MCLAFWGRGNPHSRCPVQRMVNSVPSNVAATQTSKCSIECIHYEISCLHMLFCSCGSLSVLIFVLVESPSSMWYLLLYINPCVALSLLGFNLDILILVGLVSCYKHLYTMSTHQISFSPFPSAWLFWKFFPLREKPPFLLAPCSLQARARLFVGLKDRGI